MRSSRKLEDDDDPMQTRREATMFPSETCGAHGVDRYKFREMGWESALRIEKTFDSAGQ